MSIPCDKTFLPVPRSSVKVNFKYQGRSFRKNGRCEGISVSQPQLVSFRTADKLEKNVEQRSDVKHLQMTD